MSLAEPQREFPASPRFELVRRLGAGGMGVVFEALDRERRQRVALKTLRTITADGLLRFKNEFRALADLQHPNLVHLGELFCADDRWFFTMELVDGSDFLSWVRPGAGGGGRVVTTDEEHDAATVDLLAQPAPQPARPSGRGVMHEDRLRDALGQLALGLYALHAAGKVHRDVKPSNVLVTAAGRLVLLDFGVIAEAASRERHVVGTVGYMAPEQAALGPISPATDWYAVGVVLYQALTGKLPFSGDADAVMTLKQRLDPAPPRQLDPSVPRDLDHLCMELLARDPAARPAGDEVLRLLHVSDAAEPLTVGGAFIGRRLELSVLGAALDESRLGHAITVYVHGESGVGKSALVRRFTEGVADGGVVLAGRCYERESVPFRAVDGVVDALARYLGELPSVEVASLLPRHVTALAQVFPVLTRLPLILNAPEPPTEGMDPQQRRRRLFTALRELLARLADRRRLVLVIDDLQWADADSLAMLAELVRPPESPSLLLVATVRSRGGGDGARGLPSLPGDVRHLHVTALPENDARELARRLLGHAAALPAADSIAVEAAGHPLFIAELVRRRQSLAEGAGPLKLDDALGARIRHLQPEARRVLDVIALAGAPLAPSVAARAAALELGELSQLVAALRSANLVRTTAVRGGEAVEPYHDRVREAAAGLLDGEARRQVHARLAEALLGSPDADPEALAVHFAEAGDAVTAARFAEAAAGEAARVLAFDRAARLYRRVLELRGAADRPPALLRALGEALADAGRGLEAARAFEEAAGRSGDPSGPDATDLRRRAAEQLLLSGHLDAGLEAVRGVLAAVGMKLPKTPQRALASLLVTRARVRLRGRKFVERDARAVAPDKLQRIDICWSIAAGLGIVDIIRGADFQARCLLLSLESGEPYRVARALAMEAGYYSTEGEKSERRANEIFAEAQALAERLGHPHALGLCELTRGIAAFCLGRFREALRLGDSADAMLRDRCTGVAWERDSAQLVALWSLYYLGELGELQRRAPALAREAAERGDLYAVTNLRSSLLPLSLLAAGAADSARREIDESMTAWSQRDFTFQHYNALLAGTHVDLYQGDGAAAARRMESSWRALDTSLILMMQQTCLEAWHLRARARIAATAAAERGAALSAVTRMQKKVARGAAPWALGLAELLAAAVALGRGERDTAVARLGDAVTRLEASDMALYALAARRRRGELLGGDDGRAEIAAVDRQLAGQKIADPERWTAMLVPLFA